MSKEKIEELAKDIFRYCWVMLLEDDAKKIAEFVIDKRGYRKTPDNIGEFSDGYHTFNELYHHRAVLFSAICNMFPEKSWKSKLHDTGDMFDGMFIVGIETEYGQATYHYDIEPYWDMFKVKELEKAPKWDGHTSSDAIERIGNMSVKGYRKQSENLIELPCKVGTTLYFLYNSPYADEPNLTPRIYKTADWYFEVDKTGIVINTSDIHSFNKKYDYYLGETAFLTKQEAEQALAKMKGGE